jgi:cytochrome c553
MLSSVRGENHLKLLAAIGVVLAGLGVLAAAAFALAVWMGERKLERVVAVKVVPVPFAKGAAPLKLGRYLFESRGCAECHAADGHGLAFIDAPNGLHVKAPDITTGVGGVVAGYTEADWVRAIRHGINPAGHALVVMPSGDYAGMSDADLAALVAYARSLAPVDGSGAEIRLPLFVKALYGVGVIRDAAETIDHRRRPAPDMTPAATAAYGEYLIQMCTGCHGPGLTGGPIAGAPPDWPPAARLVPGPGYVMGRYDTLEKFTAMMRGGKRPDGTAVSPVMPFASLRNLDDTDLGALYAYLTTPPAERAAAR